MFGDVLGWLIAITQNLVASFLAVVLGIAFTYLVRRQWDRRKVGGWRVVVRKQGKDEVDREISVDKAKEILREPSELAVFLKGVASPYGWINCDILQRGREEGLFVQDDEKRLLLIDLDRNPKPPPAISNAQIYRALEQLAHHEGLALQDLPPSTPGEVHEGQPTTE